MEKGKRINAGQGHTLGYAVFKHVFITTSAYVSEKLEISFLNNEKSIFKFNTMWFSQIIPKVSEILERKE